MSEQSLRPPEQSRLLDELLRFQWLHKTVCIPISPQHCVLVQIGIADLGAVDFTSWTLLGTIHLRGPPSWLLFHLNTHLQQSEASQVGFFSDIFAGEQLVTGRGFGTEVRNVSALQLQVSNLNVVCCNDSWMITFWIPRLFSWLLCWTGSLFTTACLMVDVVCSVWFVLTLLLQVTSLLGWAAETKWKTSSKRN